MVLTGLAVSSMVGVGAYIMLNKKTRKKAEHAVDNALDQANNYLKNMNK